jgi:hypothetical protein
MKVAKKAKTVAKVVKPKVSAKVVKVAKVAKVVKPKVSAKKVVIKKPRKYNIRGGTIEEEEIQKKLQKMRDALKPLPPSRRLLASASSSVPVGAHKYKKIGVSNWKIPQVEQEQIGVSNLQIPQVVQEQVVQEQIVKDRLVEEKKYEDLIKGIDNTLLSAKKYLERRAFEKENARIQERENRALNASRADRASAAYSITFMQGDAAGSARRSNEAFNYNLLSLRKSKHF